MLNFELKIAFYAYQPRWKIIRSSLSFLSQLTTGKNVSFRLFYNLLLTWNDEKSWIMNQMNEFWSFQRNYAAFYVALVNFPTSLRLLREYNEIRMNS